MQTPPTTKYLIANIKIPIQLNPDGTSVSLVNHSIIEIEPCNELPPENGNQLLMIQESIQKYMNSQSQSQTQNPVENEETVEIQNEDVPTHRPIRSGKNTTFRNYVKNNAHRFTSKRR